MIIGGEKIMKCTGCGAKLVGKEQKQNGLCSSCFNIVANGMATGERINAKEWAKIRARAKANDFAISLTNKAGKVIDTVEPGCA